MVRPPVPWEFAIKHPEETARILRRMRRISLLKTYLLTIGILGSIAAIVWSLL